MATLLSQLLPDGGYGSISTLPGSFKPWLAASPSPAQAKQAIAQQLLSHAAYLHQIAQKTGKELCLALEPEPFCMLETIAETCDFFAQYLYSSAAQAVIRKTCQCDNATAEAILHRHLGVCFDVCHTAVVFADTVASITALQAAGIRIAKLQLSAALKLAPVDQAGFAALAEFNDAVYLHQTFAQQDGVLQRYVDLDQALASGLPDVASEWRSHFHVPIFLDQLQHFATTQKELRELLALHRKQPICPHLEVETYTWEVLPAQYRQLDMASAIARELQWVLQQLD